MTRRKDILAATYGILFTPIIIGFSSNLSTIKLSLERFVVVNAGVYL